MDAEKPSAQSFKRAVAYEKYVGESVACNSMPVKIFLPQ
jgi:hypothetical protein